ncbi:uncharacterized protein KGF55_002077 [Candida pseudojiufengensis]|uniref:uncharacterized protein n=1 Tax=Candida pseudojiufengensis TaxID=497109 RepID=UPI002225B10C|nr:uncharacterized protein KGF55_002077 [Candida pseudojiufengensis]KAI5964135.1 hypothetical protein KGF55_002077 [Candida pseudojiufengensis]
MLSVKENVSITIRVFETVFAIILIGLTASNIERIDDYVARITYSLVINVLDMIYFSYYGFFVPVAMNGETPSFLILLCDFNFFVLYLASWGSYAANFPTCGDGNVNWGTTSESTCQIYQTTMALTIVQWVLYALDFSLFLGYSYVPEVVRYGIFHCFGLSPFYWGSIFTNFPPRTRRRCFGLFWRKADSALSSKKATDMEENRARPSQRVVSNEAGVSEANNEPNNEPVGDSQEVVNSAETPKTTEATAAV